MSSPADHYWPETCAHCGGNGKLPAGVRRRLDAHQLSPEQLEGISRAALPDCSGGGGKAFVLVLHPAQKCRQCAGAGKLFQVRCPYCKGTGWMFVLNESKHF